MNEIAKSSVPELRRPVCGELLHAVSRGREHRLACAGVRDMEATMNGVDVDPGDDIVAVHRCLC